MTGYGKAEAGRGNERVCGVKKYQTNEFKTHGVGCGWACMCRIERRCDVNLVQSKECGRHDTGTGRGCTLELDCRLCCLLAV